MNSQTDFKDFLKLSRQEALVALECDESGLTSSEAKYRLKICGLNEIKQTPNRPVFLDAMLHSANPLTIILLIAAFISFFTQNVANSGIIFIIILIGIIFDYLQNHRSLITIKRLQTHVTTTATVLRNNQWVELPHYLIVPGDIIHLNPGDLIPADAILLNAKNLHVQQAVLSGESLPVEKEIKKESNIAFDPISECKHAIFAGTSVISGNATALVIKTGLNTAVGKIAHTIGKKIEATAFDKGITQFSLFIMHTVLILVLFILVASSFLKHDPLEILLFAIALAVGLTPEFLPMIITVTLAKGAMRMARKYVIVKNLSAIQNFGSIDIFCSDKTGTLTSGEIILERYIDSIGNISQKTLLLASLSSLFSTETQNPLNRLTLHKSIHSNPINIAIVQHEHPDIQSYHKIDEIPFSFERRCSSVVVANQHNILLITKGAPESILNICQCYEQCNKIELVNTEKLAQFKTLFQSLCNQGYRVLAIAYRKLTSKDNYFIEDEIQLTLAGFLIFTDPPHPEAAKAISTLQQLSIKVKVLTGDNELVTRHICKQLGLASDNILCGDEIDKLSEQKLAKLIETTTIFARVSPLQKQKIIELLKKLGHVVGYLGDGINDAPALHTADVGISVANATDVAKESADIILLKQTLRVLTLGILEGRRSFGNIMKYLIMSTSSNFGNVFSMAIAIMFLPFLPMTPIQILLNNFLYDIAQITIPTDKVDSQFMRKPKRWDINIIRRFMLYAGPASSLFDFLTFYILLTVFHASTALFQTGWFVESFATQTLVIFIIRTTKNPFSNRPSTPLIITVLTTIGIVIWLPFSPLAKWLGFVPLPLHYLVFLSCTIPTYLLLIEYIKRKIF